MNSLNRTALALSVTAVNITVGTIALSSAAAQAGEVLQTRSTLARLGSVLAQLDQNDLGQDNLEQNSVNDSAPETPEPLESPLETIPAPPDTGTTLPSPLEPTPPDPSSSAGDSESDSGTSALDPGETLPQTPTTPTPTLDNGVVPDRPPAPVQPLNNLPNNNVPDPRQNVPNPSIDTTPN